VAALGCGNNVHACIDSKNPFGILYDALEARQLHHASLIKQLAAGMASSAAIPSKVMNY
jgi:hypothetical protein